MPIYDEPIGPVNHEQELSRLENLRRQAVVDMDVNRVNEIDKRMKELRAFSGEQTFGDRASDVLTSIVSGTGGQLTNTVGFGAQVYNDPAKYQRDIDRLQGYLDSDRDGNGAPLNQAQRDGLKKSIEELKEKKKKAESETSLHNRIYKAADQMSDDSQAYQEQAKAGLGATGQMLVDATTSFGQSMLTGAVGAATGTGMLPFAVTAFGGATQEARRKGADLGEQLAYGAAQAGKEYLTEKLFGIALPQKIAGSTGSADELIEKGLRKAVERFVKTEAGQRVAGGIGTWLLGGITEGTEELIGAAIENIAINPYLRNFDPDTRTSEEKWEEAWYSALVGGISGLLGVTNLVSYQPGKTTTTQSGKDTSAPTNVSSAAAPEVQQLEQRAAETKAANPKATVLDAAATLFMKEQGCNQKTAEIRAEIVRKLVSGETVSDKDLNRIDPTNKQTKVIFTQLTGVQFPDGKLQIEQLRNLYRSAHEVAVAAEQAQVQQAAVDNAQPVVDNGGDSTAEQQVPQKQAVDQMPVIDEFAARYREFRPDATDSEIKEQYAVFQKDYETALSTITLPSGTTVTKDQFKTFIASWNKQSGNEMTDETLERQFDWFRANAGNADVAATLEAIAEDMKEENANAGEGVSSGDGVRRSGQSEGERSGEVPEGRRGTETQNQERGSSGNAAEQSREESGEHRVDARDAGQTRAEEVKALRDRKPQVRTVKVDGENISVLHAKELDEGSKRVRSKFAKIGSQVYFTLGNLPVVVNGKRLKGKRAAGIHFRNVTYVQMDNLVSTGEQLGDHEFIHELLMKFPQLREKMQSAFEALPVEVQEGLFDGYASLYEKTLEGKSPDVVYRTIMDEIFCDAYGNIDRSGLGAPVLRSQIAGIADTFVEGYAESQKANKQKQISDSKAKAKKETRDFALSEEDSEKLKDYLAEMGMYGAYNDWFTFKKGLEHVGDKAVIKLSFEQKEQGSIALIARAKMLASDGTFKEFGVYDANADGFENFKEELPEYLEIALDNKMILEQESVSSHGYPYEEDEDGDPIFKLIDANTGELYTDGFSFEVNAGNIAMDMGYKSTDVQVIKHPDGALEAFVDDDGKVMQIAVANPHDDISDLPELPDDWLLDDEDMPDLPDWELDEHYDLGDPHYAPDWRLQENREGFTPTNTPEFKAWFHDDSGWLTLADGRPKVLSRGTTLVGPTTARLYSEANSGGTFASDQEEIAADYGNGMTSSGYHIGEVIGLERGKAGSDEVKTGYKNTWSEMRDFIRENYLTGDASQHGLNLVPKNGRRVTNTQSAKVFELWTDILPEDQRVGYDSKEHQATSFPVKVTGEKRILATYPNTPEGLDQLNRDLGVYIRELDIGIPGHYKFYGSAKNTFVLNCDGHSYKSIPNNILPEWARSTHRAEWDPNSHINGIVRRAFKQGYDCVVAANIDDVGEIQTQYIFRDPNQIKSVYNKGTWDAEDADRNFALSEEDTVLSDHGLRNNYGSWNELFQSVVFSSGIRHNLAFDIDIPAPPFDVNTIGVVGLDGTWLATLGEYPGTKEGLKQLNADLHDLVLEADEIAGQDAEYTAVEDNYEDESDEEVEATSSLLSGFMGLLSNARAQQQSETERLDSELQDNREGFTPTDTPEFKRWHKDPTGELTEPDGRPTVFLSGDALSGYTRGRRYGTTNSPGLWHTKLHGVAYEYAKGVTAPLDFTPMDSLGVNRDKGAPVDELKHKVLETWDEAVAFIHDTYRNQDNQGVRLVPVRAGMPTTRQSAEEFVLQTNILPNDMWWGLDEQGHLNPDEADSIFDTEVVSNTWRSLAKYPADKDGLHKLNRELGDKIMEINAGVRALSKYYISMSKPLVIDCKGNSCHHLTNDVLPEWARNDDGYMRENDFVRLAFEQAEGYDGVILKNILDEGGLQDQYCVKNPWQRKSVYNRGTWSRKDYDTRYALSEEQQSTLGDLLSRIEQEYSEGSAQKLVEAFNSRQASMLAAKHMVGMKPSVGAAELGFDPYSNLQNKYGTVEPGENPAHTIDMPAQTKGDNKVSLTPRTVMEAKATPESRIPTIEDAVVDHKFSYTEGHNKIQINRAVAKLRKDGWEDTLTNWTRDVRDGKVNADLVAMGAVMLNNAGNSDMSGARYTQLLVDYTDLLRSAGQATQAGRILKNLTPEARLYGLHGYANQINDSIRKGDPAHNIPVEKWMEVTGNLLADRLQKAVGGTRKQAKTTAQIILSDLNAFARDAFPAKEKTPGRTEMDRLQDLFNNYENYREAWEAAKETLRTEYADKPEALEVFEKFLQTDLTEAFLGRYFSHPEVRIDGALSQEFLAAKTDAERDAVIDEILKDIASQIPATGMEKFTALRYLNMLGNFKTQGRNLLGNTTNLGLTKVKNQVAAVLELAVNARGEKVERTKSFTKDKATYQAALKDFETMEEIVLAGGKYQDGRRFDERIEEHRTIFKNKVLEGYRKATNWAMTQGDLVFSRVAYADALAGYLSAHGKTFETAGETLMEQARAYAVRQAAEATFRDNNMFAEAISNMRFKNPDTFAKKAINTIAEGILPFRKTPTNILVRAVEYSPVGVLTTAAEVMYGKRVNGSVDGAKVIDSLAKNITGTGLMVLGYFLANLGLLRGAAPDDDKEKEFAELTGHQAYSIELPNGMSLTLDWLAPSSIPLFLGVQVAETAAEEGMSVRTALEALGSISDPMLQMSMLQGLDDALSNASTYGDDSALVRFTGNALWSFMTQGLTNTMLGQLERSLKNERSTTYRDKNKDLPDGIQYLLGKTMEKVPLPKVDYGQIPYIDAWGRTEQNAKTAWGNVITQFFSPSYLSYVNESDMERELSRLADVTGDSSVLISRPKSYFNVDNERKDLTGEEFVEYATLRGQTAYNVATDLTGSAIYENLTDKQKAAAVEKAYDFANQLAKATVTGYDASLWGEEAPEGVAAPDKWVVEAAQDAAEYGIPVSDYVAAYALTKDIESYVNDKGETVDNSKSLKTAVAIYDLGLSEAQTQKLMEDFGVNQTVRGYSEKMARRKLQGQKDKYE